MKVGKKKASNEEFYFGKRTPRWQNNRCSTDITVASHVLNLLVASDSTPWITTGWDVAIK